MRKQLLILFALTIGMASCTPKVFRVARPNYTLLKESTRLVGDFLGNPNGKNGHYIILNNNLQTYMSHDRVSEEIGIWRMRGDTLFLEPQLYTSVTGERPGLYVDGRDRCTPRRFLMTRKYAYDITDYWTGHIQEIPDSLMDARYLEALEKEREWIEESREVMLIMQRSEPYRWQRSFDW